MICPGRRNAKPTMPSRHDGAEPPTAHQQRPLAARALRVGRRRLRARCFGGRPHIGMSGKPTGGSANTNTGRRHATECSSCITSSADRVFADAGAGDRAGLVPIGMTPDDTGGSIMPGRWVSWPRWIRANGPASARVQAGQAARPGPFGHSRLLTVPAVCPRTYRQLRPARARPPGAARRAGPGGARPGDVRHGELVALTMAGARAVRTKMSRTRCGAAAVRRPRWPRAGPGGAGRPAGEAVSVPPGRQRFRGNGGLLLE